MLHPLPHSRRVEPGHMNDLDKNMKKSVRLAFYPELLILAHPQGTHRVKNRLGENDQNFAGKRTTPCSASKKKMSEKNW